MLIKLIQIGNSRGIRLPSSLIEKYSFKDNIKLEIEEDKLSLLPIPENPREGWVESFKEMNARGDDNLIINDSLDLDDNDGNGN